MNKQSKDPLPMTPVAHDIMQTLYGRNIWEEMTPSDLVALDLQGWNGNEKGFDELLDPDRGAHIAIDVGVWKGQSTITMAKAMKAKRINGCVIAVDTFLGSIEHWGPSSAHWAPGLFERRRGRPDIYETFLSNVVREQLSDYVVPLPQTSLSAAQILKEKGILATFVHVDAAHEYPDVIRDLEAFWPLIAEGGLLIGDDYEPAWPGVVKAAGEFSAKTERPLTIVRPKWAIEK